ncbi:MAG: hypothetical protein JWP88_57 [Flaviaesturariibacter sp.]|nr:hypothetical protein [Flaviaesturariibacter sp.]
MLLRLLKLRVIVNGSTIYYLDRQKPVVIPIDKNGPKLVASDGFHHTAPLQLNYQKQQTLCFKVGCIIEDDQLIVGAILLGILYTMGLTSGIFFIKVLSFLPLFGFLFFYYINRKKFLKFSVGPTVK